MGGGIMQLTASGVQDNYITGNPQITFFKSVYRRHTNFAIETIQQIIDGDLGTETTNTNSTVKITKTADLLNGIYIVCPQHTLGINATELINSVDLVIGGTLMDRQTNEWMKVWDELTIDHNKKEGYKYMTGGFNTTNKVSTNQSSVTIPLNFWFCRHIGLSLPLISIQYHDIILKIEWGINSEINRGGSTSITSLCEVWCDNIFLDSEERKRFGENEHEYLIEQVQTIDTINQSPSSKFKLNSFNHPLKEIIWTEDGNNVNQISNEKINITINGIERLSEQYKEYYTLKQPYQHHTNIPSYNIKEHEEPIFQETPIDSGITNHYDNPHLFTDNYNTYIKLYQNSIDFNTNATDIFKVGDIINIWRGDGADGTAISTFRKTTMTQLVTVTSIGTHTDGSNITKRVTFTPSLNGVEPSIDGTEMKSYIIARRDYSKSSYSKMKKNIYVYSFCLNPEEHQPSGTCNFSSFDDCKLNFTSNVSIDTVFAMNYNILRISNGLVSLRFTN
tara:strand:+ start:102 stop:1616 length:1515 start_codon:yes stop_codon:yes gene_type:complete